MVLESFFGSCATTDVGLFFTIELVAADSRLDFEEPIVRVDFCVLDLAVLEGAVFEEAGFAVLREATATRFEVTCFELTRESASEDIAAGERLDFDAGMSFAECLAEVVFTF